MNNLRLSTVSPTLRAQFVVGVVLLLAVSATFAAMTSSARLTGNTISSASVELQLSTDGVSFGNTIPGFDFEDVIPGTDGAPIPELEFWVRNNSPVSLGLSVGVPVAPTSTVTPSGEVDFDKVILIFERDGAASAVDHPLNDLIDSYAGGGLTLNESIPENNVPVKFTVRAQMLPDTFTGSSASISDFDLEFIGLNSID